MVLGSPRGEDMETLALSFSLFGFLDDSDGTVGLHHTLPGFSMMHPDWKPKRPQDNPLKLSQLNLLYKLSLSGTVYNKGKLTNQSTYLKLGLYKDNLASLLSSQPDTIGVCIRRENWTPHT